MITVVEITAAESQWRQKKKQRCPLPSGRRTDRPERGALVGLETLEDSHAVFLGRALEGTARRSRIAKAHVLEAFDAAVRFKVDCVYGVLVGRHLLPSATTKGPPLPARREM